MAEDPRRETSRLAFLEAAARVIARKGFHGMSMRTLAKEMGRSLTSFYTYFESKDEVLHDIQRRAFETLLRESEEAMAGADDPATKLYAFILQHVRYVAAHHEVMQVLVHEARALPANRRRSVRRLKDKYFENLRTIVEELLEASPERGRIDDGELERLTYSLFGMLNWTYGWYAPRRHGSPSDVARSIHRLALCGLLDSTELTHDQLRLDAEIVDSKVPPLLATSRRVA
jgi:AcrR family transcriptional regulator